mmetsp:Transcript_175260/g.562108  ORF Transcript_175260/g.562108 Transcript_175260/m.562108 type:complete len:205 (-) Transcript_175260:696-1310(-)
MQGRSRGRTPRHPRLPEKPAPCTAPSTTRHGCCQIRPEIACTLSGSQGCSANRRCRAAADIPNTNSPCTCKSCGCNPTPSLSESHSWGKASFRACRHQTTAASRRSAHMPNKPRSLSHGRCCGSSRSCNRSPRSTCPQQRCRPRRSRASRAGCSAGSRGASGRRPCAQTGGTSRRRPGRARRSTPPQRHGPRKRRRLGKGRTAR